MSQSHSKLTYYEGGGTEFRSHVAFAVLGGALVQPNDLGAAFLP